MKPPRRDMSFREAGNFGREVSPEERRREFDKLIKRIEIFLSSHAGEPMVPVFSNEEGRYLSELEEYVRSHGGAFVDIPWNASEREWDSAQLRARSESPGDTRLFMLKPDFAAFEQDPTAREKFWKLMNWERDGFLGAKVWIIPALERAAPRSECPDFLSCARLVDL